MLRLTKKNGTIIALDVVDNISLKKFYRSRVSGANARHHSTNAKGGVDMAKRKKAKKAKKTTKRRKARKGGKKRR